MTADPTRMTADELWAALENRVGPLGPENVALPRAVGRVLAGDARALHDFPPFDRAMMDGYAVRVADFSGQAAVLRTIGLAEAGQVPTTAVEPGTCMRINTGAPLPPGADAVVMVENARQIDEGRLELNDQPQVGQHVDPHGGLVRAGSVVAAAGTAMTPASLGALAAAGVTRVAVHVRPRVIIVTTGGEVVEAGTPLRPGQIADANGLMLRVLVGDAGGDLVRQDHCADDANALRTVLRRGLASDLLLVIGGMSKGTHDLVPGLLAELGVEWLNGSLHLKPGKPTRIGRTASGWVAGMPGNPVSCVTIFELFVRGMLRRMQRGGGIRPPHVQARLSGPLPANGDRPMYTPGIQTVSDEGVLHVRPETWRSSGDPFILLRADALVYRDAETLAAVADDTVQVVPLARPPM